MIDATKHDPANGDVRAALSRGALASLRAAWARAPTALTSSAHSAMTAPYPPAGDCFNALGEHAYQRPESIAPRERERCVIAVLAAKDLETGYLLPIHFYWGLMEGLEPAEIAETLFMAGMYSGIANYLSSISRFQSVLGVLSELVAQAADLHPLQVVAQIRATFSYVSVRGSATGRREEPGIRDAPKSGDQRRG